MMERPKKPYYEFSPRNDPGKRFPPPDKTFNVRDTTQRRVHMADYFVFMRPEVQHMMREYGQRATRTACQKLYDYGLRALPAKYFECMVDRMMWMFWFLPYGLDGPPWPWDLAFPATLSKGETPSQIFDRYCEDRNDEEEHIKAFNESIEASTTFSTDDDRNNEYIVQSKALFADPTPDGIPLDGEREARKALWEEAFRKGYRNPYSAGPFEMELPWYTPLDRLVTNDLVSINELVPTGVKVQLNVTNRKIIVAFCGRLMIDDQRADRQAVIRTWEHVRNWIELVRQSKDVTLLHHLTTMCPRT
ncbi:hypothetical protein FHETE_10610 [Fusarium heterosporum]|uniref:Uncharacterized protein n=1 Tax=Fusarium heterosporum TaxID=42747 RepID=A0A8H5SP21_FUSHE|nr:hypothetical protein FHETE_10610 [Fusarium heterosporum]